MEKADEELDGGIQLALQVDGGIQSTAQVDGGIEEHEDKDLDDADG